MLLNKANVKYTKGGAPKLWNDLPLPLNTPPIDPQEFDIVRDSFSQRIIVCIKFKGNLWKIATTIILAIHIKEIKVLRKHSTRFLRTEIRARCMVPGLGPLIRCYRIKGLLQRKNKVWDNLPFLFAKISFPL